MIPFTLFLRFIPKSVFFDCQFWCSNLEFHGSQLEVGRGLKRELLTNAQLFGVPGVDHYAPVEHLRRDLHMLAEAFTHLRHGEALTHTEVHPWVVTREDGLLTELQGQLVIGRGVGDKRADHFLNVL